MKFISFLIYWTEVFPEKFISVLQDKEEKKFFFSTVLFPNLLVCSVHLLPYFGQG